MTITDNVSAPANSQTTRLPLNVLLGIPDDRACTINPTKGAQTPSINLPGTTSLLPYLPRQKFALRPFYLGPGPSNEKIVFGPGPFLNHVADPDRCANVLKKIETIATQSGRAVFNHPAAVAKTKRDMVARALSGNRGLIVPKTIRLIAGEIEVLRSAISEAELSYPVLVRIAGDHGGVSTMKIDTPDELPTTVRLNCYGKAIYVTEFRDFMSPDGRYRKYRVVVVGGRIFLRHMIVGDNWLLHAQRRSTATEPEEGLILQTFDRDRAPRLLARFQEIARRLDLDYFGVDCNIAENDDVLLFEANACMNILDNTAPSPNMWDKPIARIRGALSALLSTPRNWRHPARPKAAAAV